MNDWDYAQGVPAYTFRSAMTLPRVLKLRAFDGGLRLVSRPVPELQALRQGEPLRTMQDTWVEGGRNPLLGLSGVTLEILAEFQVDGGTTASEFGLKLRQGDGKETVVGYEVQPGAMFVDRTRSGEFEFRGDDGGGPRAPPAPAARQGELHNFLHPASVEGVGNDGRPGVTPPTFPPPP